ncbi:hypothetical protein M0R45_035732 [Rubus argutus]|uniref:Uncharacterized protein n=1 Tax=Rubus argutus TaxID=59490 RepID=A0AAW1VXR6_RUBAR
MCTSRDFMNLPLLEKKGLAADRESSLGGNFSECKSEAAALFKMKQGSIIFCFFSVTNFSFQIRLLCSAEKLLSGSEVSKMELSMLLRFKRMPDLVQKWVVYVEVDEEVLRTSSQYYGLEDFENIDVQVGDAIKVLEKLSPLANGHHLSSFVAHRVDDGSGVDGHSDIDIKL